MTCNGGGVRIPMGCNNIVQAGRFRRSLLESLITTETL